MQKFMLFLQNEKVDDGPVLSFATKYRGPATCRLNVEAIFFSTGFDTLNLDVICKW